MDPSSLVSLADPLEKLGKDGDLLEVLDATVDFEYFRTWLVEGLGMGMAPRVVVRRLIRCRCSRR